jgi:hypothetical protein
VVNVPNYFGTFFFAPNPTLKIEENTWLNKLEGIALFIINKNKRFKTW